jgi:uncharacterized protein
VTLGGEGPRARADQEQPEAGEQRPHARGKDHAKRALRAIAVAPIVLYQRLISPAIPRRCKYHPTCSRYAVDAIREYGILRGAVLAAWRLLRCNPWSYGGYDPVEAQRVFTIGHRTGA